MPRIALGGMAVVATLLVVAAVGPPLTVATVTTPTPTVPAVQPGAPSPQVPRPALSVTPSVPAVVTAVPTVATERGDEQFDLLRDEALSRPLVFGPAEGELPMDQQRISFEAAGLTLRDFAVHVTFTNPASGAEHAWDYGLLFRAGDAHVFQLAIASTGGWLLALDGGAAAAQSGSLATLNRSADGTNSLDLIAIGDRGYFGVNGVYVATLDLAANPDPGDVAIAAGFFEDGYIAGGSTPYEDFIVWSFDEATASPVAAASPTTPATEEPIASPAATEASAPDTGTGYTSPTYGYSIAWGDDWSEVTRSSEDGYDFLRLESTAAFVDLSGFPWSGSAEDCIDALVLYYQGETGYGDVAIATDAAGDEQRGTDGEIAWAVIDFTFASTGRTDEYRDYAECRPIVPGESILSFEYISLRADAATQTAARETLLAGLTLPGAGSQTPAATATAAGGFALGPVGLTLAERDGSGVTGLATLAESPKEAQTEVKVLVVGAPPGAVAIVHAGACDDFDPAPAYLLSPLDATGASDTIIAATLRDLRVMGEYAIAIHASVDDLSSPIACGEIPTAG